MVIIRTYLFPYLDGYTGGLPCHLVLICFPTPMVTMVIIRCYLVPICFPMLMVTMVIIRCYLVPICFPMLMVILVVFRKYLVSICSLIIVGLYCYQLSNRRYKQ